MLMLILGVAWLTATPWRAGAEGGATGEGAEVRGQGQGGQAGQGTPEVVLQLKYDGGELDRILLTQYRAPAAAPAQAARTAVCADLCFAETKPQNCIDIDGTGSGRARVRALVPQAAAGGAEDGAGGRQQLRHAARRAAHRRLPRALREQPGCAAVQLRRVGGDDGGLGRRLRRVLRHRPLQAQRLWVVRGEQHGAQRAGAAGAGAAGADAAGAAAEHGGGLAVLVQRAVRPGPGRRRLQLRPRALPVARTLASRHELGRRTARFLFHKL